LEGKVEMRFVVSRHGLEPFDAGAREFLESQLDGEPIELEPVYPRDMVEHRRIMAQIGELAKALGTDFEKVRAQLLVSTGNFRLVDDQMGGPPIVCVSSMSRHHMRDHELHAFWEDAKKVIRTRLLERIPDAAERDRLAESFSLQAA
jgi:hypothetical protein